MLWYLQMGEFELIRRYFAAAVCARTGAGVALGIGDDCALLELSPGEQLAVSSDSLVAGIHFPHDCDPFLLAQRGLACAASDLAAMGAAPIGFTLALTLPLSDPAWLEAFARGLETMAEHCGLRLVGGDTTRGPLNINFNVFGRVPRGLALTRNGARPGDLLLQHQRQGQCGAGHLRWPAGRLWAHRPRLGRGLAPRTGPGAAVTSLARRARPGAGAALRLEWRRRLLAGLQPAAGSAAGIAGGRLADHGHRSGRKRAGRAAVGRGRPRAANHRTGLRAFPLAQDRLTLSEVRACAAEAGALFNPSSVRVTPFCGRSHQRGAWLGPAFVIWPCASATPGAMLLGFRIGIGSEGRDAKP
jgi:hypothetical protein